MSIYNLLNVQLILKKIKEKEEKCSFLIITSTTNIYLKKKIKKRILKKIN